MEDALRRDITINALFYNIHTRQVEDWTGLGIQDLKEGLIRTPLPPRQTFNDDPLRILRVIRFATRFGYRLDEAIIMAAKEPEIKESFLKKISRERVGVEVEKMLRGQDPARSMRILIETGYFKTVFGVYDGVTTLDHGDQALAHLWALQGLLSYVRVSSPLQDSIGENSGVIEKQNRLKNAYHETQINRPNDQGEGQGIKLDPQQKYDKDTIETRNSLTNLLLCIDAEDQKRVYLAALLAGYRHEKIKVKNKDHSAIRLLVMNSIKLSTLDAEWVSALLECESKIADHVQTSVDSKVLGTGSTKYCLDRKSLGLLIREIGGRPIKGKWNLCFIVSLMLKLAPLYRPGLDCKSIPEANQCIQNYLELYQSIQDHDLGQAYNLKPLLDGKEIAALLKMQPGKKIGLYLQQLIEWQLAHPKGTKQDGEQWLLHKLKR